MGYYTDALWVFDETQDGVVGISFAEVMEGLRTAHMEHPDEFAHIGPVGIRRVLREQGYDVFSYVENQRTNSVEPSRFGKCELGSRVQASTALFIHLAVTHSRETGLRDLIEKKRYLRLPGNEDQLERERRDERSGGDVDQPGYQVWLPDGKTDDWSGERLNGSLFATSKDPD
jgi:hypothetical protein